MSPIVWLASYPKSGNTWMRILISNLSAGADAPSNINALREARGIASSRETFDKLTLLESGLLTHSEIDLLRPAVYRAWAAELAGEMDESRRRFIKCHDAYTRLEDGTPLFGGAAAARGAILVVRDPRDIASSFADHRGCSIDEAIDLMLDPDAVQADTPRGQNRQLRQRLLDWSSHVASWLDQEDIPVHLIHYESLEARAAAMLENAMRFAGRPVTDGQMERAVRFSTFERVRAQEEAAGFTEARTDRPFFRRGKAGAWRTELSSDQAGRLESAHGPMMTRLGYETAT